MRHVTGLIGRDDLIENIAREARKGRHLLLTGRPGIGKSSVLEAVLEMRHAAGVRDFDFTPVMIVALASVVGARCLAIGTGDTELYVFAGMLAAVVISIRVFLFQGRGQGELARIIALSRQLRYK